MKPIIYSNILTSMGNIVLNMKRLGIVFEDPIREVSEDNTVGNYKIYGYTSMMGYVYLVALSFFRLMQSMCSMLCSITNICIALLMMFIQHWLSYGKIKVYNNVMNAEMNSN